jgi:hypothetical protein
VTKKLLAAAREASLAIQIDRIVPETNLSGVRMMVSRSKLIV